MIEIVLSERDFDYELQALVTAFFPGNRNRVLVCPAREEADLRAFMRAEETVDSMLWTGAWFGREQICVWLFWEERMHKKTAAVSGDEDFHKHADKTTHPYRATYKNILKGLFFTLFSECVQELQDAGISVQIPAWGTMTGVRPTRIPMERLLAGEPLAQVARKMKEEYRCSPEKTELCLEIAAREAALLAQAEYRNGYSIYVGIPFCPSTCLYCSFPSYALDSFASLTPAYVEALKKEIRICGTWFAGKHVTSVYLGGGTPTALSADQLEEVLSCLFASFPLAEAQEVTVEAGRPDSITQEKLRVIRSFGVERISVNPQTMQDETLARIGRKHTVQETVEAFALARKYGFSNINMDLIAGLPGETPKEFADTLRRIRSLDPDSVTVHSLVVKRASRLRQQLEEGKIPETERARDMEAMLEMAQQFAQENAYLPYYMYRQKNFAGHAGSSGQENIGFARAGKECLYNILIMEEVQSILALGAGASTKRYDAEKQIVRRVENVRSVTDYIDRIDEMLQRKRALWEGR